MGGSKRVQERRTNAARADLRLLSPPVHAPHAAGQWTTPIGAGTWNPQHLRAWGVEGKGEVGWRTTSTSGNIARARVREQVAATVPSPEHKHHRAWIFQNNKQSAEQLRVRAASSHPRSPQFARTADCAVGVAVKHRQQQAVVLELFLGESYRALGP